MDNKSNALNWFEVPALDIARAKVFYEAIFAVQLSDMPSMNGMKMAAFPADWASGKVSGAIAETGMHKPSQDGVVIYLNTEPDIQSVIDRIEPSGGKVVMPKTQISPEIGYMAFFIDTEGNKIGLHSSK
ncbi:MAG: VOC family protein [Ignavibacteria bacterium]|nr:VOC family protein [Ignavibacteria bacterium]